MQNKDNHILADEIKEKLDWYISHTPEEDYDEKVVDSFLELLDNLEPLEEQIPRADDAWVQFQEIVRQREALDAGEEIVGQREALGAGKEIVGQREALGAGKEIVGQRAALGAGKEAVGQREALDAGEEIVGQREALGAGKEAVRQRVALGAGKEIVRQREALDAGEEAVRQREALDAGEEIVGQKEALDAGEEIVGQREALSAGEEIVGQREALSAGEEAVRQRAALGAGEEIVGQREALDTGEEAVRQREALSVKEEGKSKRNKSRDPEKDSVSHGSRRLGNILVRQKYIAAAVLLALVLGVVGATQTMAGPDSGFFYWLRRDAAGTEMVTSPENLDESTGKRERVYYSRDDVPDWADEWLEIEENFQMPKEYKWERYEVNVFDYVQCVVGFYINASSGEEILLGMILYKDQISHNSENFLGYSYMENYEAGEKKMEIYCRVEENGKTYYMICFQEGNCQYFIRGQDDLEELKGLAEGYYGCVKNNLQKNKIFCNKMSAEVIYK